MSNIEDHGIPDHVQQRINQLNRMMYPTYGLGLGSAKHLPYPPSNPTNELLNNYEREVRRLERENKGLVSKVADQAGIIDRLSERLGNSWNDWKTLGSLRIKSFDTVINRQGLSVLAVGEDQQFWHCLKRGSEASFSNWQSLGGEITSDIDAGANKDGRLEVVARGTDNGFTL